MFGLPSKLSTTVLSSGPMYSAGLVVSTKLQLKQHRKFTSEEQVTCLVCEAQSVAFLDSVDCMKPKQSDGHGYGATEFGRPSINRNSASNNTHFGIAAQAVSTLNIVTCIN